METTIVAERIVGSTTVIVRRLDGRAEYCPPSYITLPVWFRRGSRVPHLGERVDTWTDVSTLYAMAPLAG